MNANKPVLTKKREKNKQMKKEKYIYHVHGGTI